MGNISAVVEYNPGEDLDELHPAFNTFVLVIQVVLCVVGGAGNLLTVLAVVTCKHLHKTHNVYIVHLAFVDMIINLGLIPISICILTGVITIPPYCDVVGAVAFCALVVSILSLMMIAINRYILICRTPHIYSKVYNKRTVPWSIVAMWVWAVLLVAPMDSFNGLGWSQKTHYCFFQNYNFAAYLYMNVGLCQLGVVWPSIITSICYTLIILKLRANARKLGVHTASSSVATTTMTESTDPSSDADDDGPQLKVPTVTLNDDDAVRRQMADRRAAKQKAHNRRIFGLILIFVIFMTCWMPIAVTTICDIYQKLPGWVYVLLITIAWINSSVNVFLYAGTNQSYRHVFKCILTCNFDKINARM